MEDLMMEIDRDPMTRKKINLYKVIELFNIILGWKGHQGEKEREDGKVQDQVDIVGEDPVDQRLEIERKRKENTQDHLRQKGGE